MACPGGQSSGLTTDNNHTSFAEQEETSSLLDSSGGKEPVFIEWTDEKHSMYLKSMEASFVDQLYNSRDFLGRRPQNDHLFGSNPRLCRQEYQGTSAQKINIGEGRSQARGSNERGGIVSGTPWISHFDATGLRSDTWPVTHPEMNGFLRMEPPSCGRQDLHSYGGSENMLKRNVIRQQCQVSLDGNEEVSDQNFIDEGPSEGNSEGIPHGTKRKSLEATPSMLNDQVVPFGASHCPMPDLGEGCSSSTQLVGRDYKATKTGSSAF